MNGLADAENLALSGDLLTVDAVLKAYALRVLPPNWPAIAERVIAYVARSLSTYPSRAEPGSRIIGR